MCKKDSKNPAGRRREPTPRHVPLTLIDPRAPHRSAAASDRPSVHARRHRGRTPLPRTRPTTTRQDRRHRLPVLKSGAAGCDGGAVPQTLLRQSRDMGPDEADFEPRIGLLHPRNQETVSLEARRAGKEHQKLIVPDKFYGLLGGHLMRGSIQQARTGQHAGRIGQPNWIPVRLNFASGGPA